MAHCDQPERFQAVDALRGIAALGVMIFHLSLEFSRNYSFSTWVPPEWIEGLRYGPHFFYVISGFVIFMTIDRATSGSSFFKARLIRLMPAFWVALVATSLVTYLWGPDLLKFELVDLFANAFLLQGFLDRPHIDGAYWSLLVEMAFYSLAALVVFVFKWRSRIAVVMWVWLVLSVILLLYPEYRPYPLSILSDELLIPRYSVYFIIGMSMYLGYKNGKTPLNLKILTAIGIFLISLGLAPLPYGVCLSGAIVVLWLAIKGRLDWLLVNRPLLWLGALSYPLYLIHQNIGITLMHFMIERGVSDAMSFMAACGLSLALAQIIFSLVEKPSRAWLTRRYLKT